MIIFVCRDNDINKVLFYIYTYVKLTLDVENLPKKHDDKEEID